MRALDVQVHARDDGFEVVVGGRVVRDELRSGDVTSRVIPEDATTVHYEGEMVVVIGKTASHVDEADVSQHIFGITAGNDVSERHWQRDDLQWVRANPGRFFARGRYEGALAWAKSAEAALQVLEPEPSFTTASMLMSLGSAHRAKAL